MTAQSRNYSAADYGACRYVWENRLLAGSPNSQRTAVATLGPLTVALAERLKRLNLLDGDEAVTVDGDLVRLSGLGVKTAKEALRLGIAAAT